MTRDPSFRHVPDSALRRAGLAAVLASWALLVPVAATAAPSPAASAPAPAAGVPAARPGAAVPARTATPAAPSAVPAAGAAPVARPAPAPVAAGSVQQVAPAAAAPRAPSPAARAPGAATPSATTAAQAAAPLVELDLFVGESRVLAAPGVARIAVGNGQVLTASALDQREVLVFANAPGVSTLFIWDAKGQMQRLKLTVTASDIGRLAREVGQFLQGVPGVRVSAIGDKVIVEGDQLGDTDLMRIEQLAKRYPQIVNFTNRQGWEQMVMLDVKVVEFPVNELRELGLRWSATGGAAIGGVWSPFSRVRGGALEIGLPGGASVTAPGANGGVLPTTPNVLSVLNLGLGAQLQALAQTGRTTMLAEPQLSARNGSKASFLAGGEIPYTVSTVNGPTTQFKPYGVRLDILPRVDRGGHVRATIETEFSQVDPTTRLPNNVPAFLVRRTSTEFNVRAGETIVLSGLVQREQSTAVDKVPGLGDVPVLGALFRSKRFQNRETELVVFVTPTVVDPRTPAVAERVDRTIERLDERLAPAPHLSEPLQPARRPAAAPAEPAAGADGGFTASMLEAR